MGSTYEFYHDKNSIGVTTTEIQRNFEYIQIYFANLSWLSAETCLFCKMTSMEYEIRH